MEGLIFGILRYLCDHSFEFRVATPNTIVRLLALDDYELYECFFRKDFWDFPKGKGKHWPTADGCDPINDPRNTRGTHFGTSPLIVSLQTIRLEIRLSYFRCLSRCRYIYGENMS